MSLEGCAPAMSATLSVPNEGGGRALLLAVAVDVAAAPPSGTPPHSDTSEPPVQAPLQGPRPTGCCIELAIASTLRERGQYMR